MKNVPMFNVLVFKAMLLFDVASENPSFENNIT